MKLGFNEATALECKGQSLMADLEACEKSQSAHGAVLVGCGCGGC